MFEECLKVSSDISSDIYIILQDKGEKPQSQENARKYGILLSYSYSAKNRRWICRILLMVYLRRYIVHALKYYKITFRRFYLLAIIFILLFLFMIVRIVRLLCVTGRMKK